MELYCSQIQPTILGIFHFPILQQNGPMLLCIGQFSANRGVPSGRTFKEKVNRIIVLLSEKLGTLYSYSVQTARFSNSRIQVQASHNTSKHANHQVRWALNVKLKIQPLIHIYLFCFHERRFSREFLMLYLLNTNTIAFLLLFRIVKNLKVELSQKTI